MGQGFFFGAPAELPDRLPAPSRPLPVLRPAEHVADSPFAVAAA